MSYNILESWAMFSRKHLLRMPFLIGITPRGIQAKCPNRDGSRCRFRVIGVRHSGIATVGQSRSLHVC
ncbi:MAG TPA: hypothetical protein VFS97_11130 [Nitrososphaeraceae archaeon]|nr:hypothetical protein [Nitrososphaeraceae archaeon]